MRGIPLVIAAAALVAAACAGATGAAAQRATERYIPIGQSPGASDQTTIVGRLDAVNLGARTLTVASGAVRRPAKIDDRTDIWLDRSKYGQPNVPAAMADLKPGSLVEIKFSDPAGTIAQWIKVEATN